MHFEVPKNYKFYEKFLSRETTLQRMPICTHLSPHSSLNNTHLSFLLLVNKFKSFLLN